MAIGTSEAYWAALRADLMVFMRHSFATLFPTATFYDNWHLHAIVHCLERSIEGQMPRLLINMPPRHLKSFIVSVVLPAFLLGLDPTTRIICISYSDELARTLAREFRRIVDSDWYRRVFPHVRFVKGTESEVVTEAGGGRFATSIGGTLTGRGADFIIVDDPIKAEDALSDRIRISTQEWYKNTLLSRLDDKKLSVLIIVMQRLHVSDLTGFVQDTGGFHKLSLPAIAIKDEDIRISATETYHREAGEALHADREDLATLEAMRDQISPATFAAQYQQRPETPDGALFKRKYIKIVDESHQIEPGGYYWVSVDAAASTSPTACFSAITYGYSNRMAHYVLDVERGRWDYEMLRDKVMAYVKPGRNFTFIIEAASNGNPLIQHLRKRGLPTMHSNPRDDKLTRASRTLDIVQEGRLVLVSHNGRNGWVEPFLNEVVDFPFGRFNDQVDSVVQALIWAERMSNPGSRIYFA